MQHIQAFGFDPGIREVGQIGLSWKYDSLKAWYDTLQQPLTRTSRTNMYQ